MSRSEMQNRDEWTAGVVATFVDLVGRRLPRAAAGLWRDMWELLDALLVFAADELPPAMREDRERTVERAATALRLIWKSLTERFAATPDDLCTFTAYDGIREAVAEMALQLQEMAVTETEPRRKAPPADRPPA